MQSNMLAALIAAASAVFMLHSPARAQAFVGWGSNTYGQATLPPLPPGRSVAAVAAGNTFSVVLLDDGTLKAWGYNSDGQAVAPDLPPSVRATKVAAGGAHALALLDDGSIVVWGQSALGQHAVPPTPPGVVYVDIVAGSLHSVALRSDGVAVAWGHNGFGQCNVPPAPAGLSYDGIAAGFHFTVLRRSDGAVVAFGENNYGQCDVANPQGAIRYTQIAAGGYRTMALRNDGVIESWGLCSSSCTCCVPPAPYGSPYVRLSVGASFTTALRADGVIVAVGDNTWQQSNAPPSPTGDPFVQVSAGASHGVALTGVGCELMANYCTAGTTVHGCVPSISGVGAPSSQASNGFDLVVSNVEGQRYGLIYYGFYPVAVPWSPASTSYRCVSFPQQRTPVVDSGGVAGQCNGELRLDFNAWRAGNPGGLGNPFVAGQVFYAQGWFRDPGAPKQTNLSDGLRFVLCQ